MDDALRWLLDLVESVDPVLRTTLAGIAMLLETSVLVGLIVPGDTVVIVAATGVTSVLDGVILAIVVICGSLAGESIGFALGRWLGPHIRTSWVGRRIGERNWVRAERYVQRRGGIAIFLSRFLPVMHSLVPLTVGMSTYPYRRFILWTLPACVIWATLYVSISAGAAQSYRSLSDTAHWAAYIFVGAILLLVVGVFIAKKVIAHLERRHLDD
ncbi:DedA family protein [Microbacterium paludicola]|uniref:DedA family protein n=1 Tax=Microbacterium paludicola TaxID=300019 RepID=UPI0031D5A8E5